MCRSGTAYIINSSPSRTCLRIALVRVCLMIQFLLPLFINLIEWNGQLIAWWELWLRFLDWEFPSAMFYIINIFLQTGCQSSLYRPLHNKTLWKKKIINLPHNDKTLSSREKKAILCSIFMPWLSFKTCFARFQKYF